MCNKVVDKDVLKKALKIRKNTTLSVGRNRNLFPDSGLTYNREIKSSCIIFQLNWISLYIFLGGSALYVF